MLAGKETEYPWKPKCVLLQKVAFYPAEWLCLNSGQDQPKGLRVLFFQAWQASPYSNSDLVFVKVTLGVI